MSPPTLAGLGSEWEFAGLGRPRKKTVPGRNSLPTRTAERISRKQKHWCIGLASIPDEEWARIMALPSQREKMGALRLHVYGGDQRGSVKLPRDLFALLSSVARPGLSVSDLATRLIVRGILGELADAEAARRDGAGS